MLNKKDIFNISLLILVTMLFFWQVLAEPKELLASGDLLSDSVFSSNFMHKTFQEYGERALWNPFFFAGKPHLAHIEYGQYYFTSLLFLLSYKDYYLNFVFMIHFFLAGLFMYMFLRSIKLTRSSATIGAIAFMLGRNFLDLFAGDILPAVAFSYVPLVFLGLEKLLEKRNLNWSILFAIFVSIQFFAGRVQYFYYTMLALTLYTIIRLYSLKKENSKAALSVIGYMAVSAIIFLGIASIQLLPMIEIAPHTLQNADTEVATYEFSAQESVPPKHFITSLIPKFFGERADNSYWGAPSRMIDLYIGVLPLILAIIAMLFAKNRHKWPLTALAVFSVLFALGKYAPFYRIFHEFLPGVSMFKVPGRMLMVFTFSMASLAAIGANHILNNRINKWTLSILGFASIIGASMTAGILAFKPRILSYGTNLFNQYYYSTYAGTDLVSRHSFEYFAEKIPAAFNNVFMGILILTSLIFLSYLAIQSLSKSHIKKTRAAMILIAIAIIDLLLLTNSYDWNQIKETSYPGSENSDQYFKQWEPITEQIRQDKSLVRVTGFPQPILAQNSLYSLPGSDSMPLSYSSKYSTYAGQLTEAYAPFMLGLANVKYVLTREELSENYVLLKGNLIYSDCRFGANKSFNLYENQKWMPRAFMVPDAKTIELEDHFEIIKNQGFDPKNEVLITEKIDKEGGQEYKEAAIAYYSPNKVKLDVTTEKPGFLVISDTYYPGWKAYDNGQEVKIYRANYIMRALYLPAGEHNVEFVYDPMSYKIGKWITFATLVLVGFLVLFLIMPRNKQPI